MATSHDSLSNLTRSPKVSAARAPNAFSARAPIEFGPSDRNSMMTMHSRVQVNSGITHQGDEDITKRMLMMTGMMTPTSGEHRNMGMDGIEYGGMDPEDAGISAYATSFSAIPLSTTDAHDTHEDYGDDIDYQMMVQNTLKPNYYNWV